MTQRKPHGTTWESWIDAQIRKAREEGRFDDLPGQGEPLPDLGEADDPLWWARKWARREGLPLLPAALEIRRRVERELAGLSRLRREEEVRAKVAELNAEIARINSRAGSGPPSSQPLLHVDRVLARWRAEREH